MRSPSARPVGSFCLVLHSHLPWLAHHGAWPVGETWLHQAWSHSYIPVLELLERLGEAGRTDLLTLGITPVLAAQLDDGYCLDQQHLWLGDQLLRAQGMAGSADRERARHGRLEAREAARALDLFEHRWSAGGSPVLRPLVDSGVVELLGGPAAHPFQPLLEPSVLDFSLRAGLQDAKLRLGSRPQGIWAPECGYTPGLEQHYAAAGVTHFLVDGPTMESSGHHTAAAWRVGETVAFARDLKVTYRVWSPRKGYPGDPWYRDFHTFDHEWGFRPRRVTSTVTPPEAKAWYDPERARARVEAHAHDFVTTVRNRLLEQSAVQQHPLAVAAFDTELFGHWWHEGPLWLERVLELLPAAGVNVTTLRRAIELGHVRGDAELKAGSWGSGKDWRVWDGAQVAELVEANAQAQRATLKALAGAPTWARDAADDQLVRELLLALSSDWAFMVTKDSAAQYALDRAHGHYRALAQLLEAKGTPDYHPAAAELRRIDGPFGHLDARQLR